MAKKDSFFTRLGTTLKNTSLYKFSKKGFGKPNVTETAEDNLTESSLDQEHSADDLTEQLAENQQDADNSDLTEVPEPPELEFYPDELELEHDNPLLQLWTMHLDLGQNLPKPRLRLQNALINQRL